MNGRQTWYAPGTVSPLMSEPAPEPREVRISLLNCFAIDGGSTEEGIGRGAARELLCYLAVFRDRQHSREALLEALWSDLPAPAARKRLRQTLWQLKTALGAHALQIGPSAVSYGQVTWLDVDVFEQAYRAVSVREPSTFNEADVRRIQESVRMYGFGLLPGMYQDWCIAERDRIDGMQVLMLEQLMDYFEIRHDYRTAIGYGESILRLDPARESTHQRLILLFHAVGDRTGAIRQFRRCVAALERELGVKVSRATLDVLRQVEDDEVAPHVPSAAHASGSRTGALSAATPDRG